MYKYDEDMILDTRNDHCRCLFKFAVKSFEADDTTLKEIGALQIPILSLLQTDHYFIPKSHSPFHEFKPSFRG